MRCTQAKGHSMRCSQCQQCCGANLNLDGQHGNVVNWAQTGTSMSLPNVKLRQIGIPAYLAPLEQANVCSVLSVEGERASTVGAHADWQRR